MVQTVSIPDKTIVNLSISVPEYYVGKEMEVIAFSKEEGLMTHVFPEKRPSFDAVSINTKDIKFNRDEANER